ncbi:MAG: transporter substrate-binding domain-containing protein [Actinomycetota bacterium]|nr:transporter substrate-binding domain-containing protein [Actinomycetota bacterium]
MRRTRLLVLVSMLLLVLGAACGGGETTTADGDSGGNNTGTAGKEGNDLLAVVKERGTLIASTDPAYPPQSSRTPDGELEGFDIDVTNEIAKRLGVDVEYVTPAFNAIISGGWSGRWDLSVGSVTITPERQKVLLFTPPYYYTPASIAIHSETSDIQDTESDLDGKKIGVCVECSYQFYLQKKLNIPGESPEYVVDDADVKTYDTDTTAIQELAVGPGVRLDAAMSALPTLEQAIGNDVPIEIVGDPLFYEPLGVAVDKESPEDPKAFFEEVSKIIEEMHSDGTLTEFSKKWYDGTDLSKKTD